MTTHTQLSKEVLEDILKELKENPEDDDQNEAAIESIGLLVKLIDFDKHTILYSGLQ